MKRNSLQIRLTMLSCIILSIACVALTLTINLSANKVIVIMPIEPSYPATEIIPNGQIENKKVPSIPKTQTEEIETAQKSFRLESLFAMLGIILIGSATTYIVVGRALKPVKELTKIAKDKRVDNLTEEIALPKIKDEVYDLTLAFNEMSEHLEKSFSLQKQFSADVAHELRTPLATMQAKLEVHQINTQVGEDFTTDLLCQVERLSKLIDDLLWFSKDTPLESVQTVDIRQLVRDISEEFRQNENRISVSENQLLVKGNDALLERVFYNLLQNAIKYSGENTLIGVRILPKEKSVEVWDNGQGIPDSEKKLIFEPFYRMDKSRSREIGGNGLGLAICKKILDKHSASIEVFDNNPQGAIFKITFPS